MSMVLANANGVLEPAIEVTNKPFAIEALFTRVREMIEGVR
jgi:hypothetical protein